MPNQSPLDQVIELINQTGDNCIVLDANGKPAYVVSRFEKYRENILNKPKTVDNNQFQVDEDVPEAQADENSSLDSDNSLTYAKNPDLVDNSDQKYYFEPID